ncbi:hypothetical protein HYH03_017461 [Edaphochlamys debaryana]|uniref:PLAC8 family protein n=1 Tax=Edaphochlamys debaryana TaxID=47281 RepID=A0A836BQJ4_9CHLO|nr:hypothetical protein HYH03_017461 [Edaphochlamys debaryana]|eukprot:KAG2483658.1 hypothetical protein HYH03_017461 [Edaphochlamys debaryana]
MAYQTLAPHDAIERAGLVQSVPDSVPEPYAGLAKPGMYSTGLFDCFALPGGTSLCCLTMWCPCVQYGMNAERLAPVSSFQAALAKEPDGVFCGGNRTGACLTHFLLNGCGVGFGTAAHHGTGATCVFPFVVPLHLQLRMYLRSKYGLQAGDFSQTLLTDILALWCCAGCAICQDAREITIRQAVERSQMVRSDGSAPPMQQTMVGDPRMYAPAPAMAPGPAVYGEPVMGVPVSAPGSSVPHMPPGKAD